MAWGFSTQVSVATVLSAHPCVSSCLWVNTLRPSDAIWSYRCRSTLARVMACCLTAPSYYLNQCWLIFSKVQWHSVEGNLTRDNYIPRIEGSGDVMVLRQSRPSPAARHPPPAARNGVNAITQKTRDGLFSNLVYTLVVIVSWPD